MKAIFHLLFVLLIVGSGVCRWSKVECWYRGCQYDFNMYCLRSGRFVFSDCKLKQAVCFHGEKEAPLSYCFKFVKPGYQRLLQKMDYIK